MQARAVMLATGAEYRRLPVAGLEAFEGTSVLYAAGPPEAHLCRAQRVAVIGGGNSAVQAAVWLARGGALVTLLHRRADLSDDEKGFILTGAEAGAEGLLETRIPGVYAAGDVRSGSIKRCATAVGEGATAVRFVHEHLAAPRATAPS